MLSFRHEWLCKRAQSVPPSALSRRERVVWRADVRR